MRDTPRISKSKRIFLPFYRLLNLLRDRFAAALGVDIERKKELYIDISCAVGMSNLVYWLQIIFSAGIATLGLILNSPAVIIGAMLISPLMNPILASGLALATGDLILGLRGLLNLVLSSLAAIGLAFFLVYILPFKEQTPEIIARTAPNTLDLVIALFSGAIGSIATSRKEKGVITSIPGVAIAVALMPPVCVVGYGIGLAVSFSREEGLAIAKGGGLLYLTNLVAITFTAMLVFFLLRIDTSSVRKAINNWRITNRENNLFINLIDSIPGLGKAREIRNFPLRFLMVLIPLGLIIIPLSQSFSKLKSEITKKQEQNRVEKTARQIWNNNFAKFDSEKQRSFIDDLRITQKENKLEIFLRVFEHSPYNVEEKNEYKRLLATNLNVPADSIAFHLLEIPISEIEEQNLQKVYKPEPVTLDEIHKSYKQRIEDSLDGLYLPEPARLLNYRIITNRDSRNELQIIYLSEREMSADAMEFLSNDLKNRVKITDTVVGFEYIPGNYQVLPLQNNGAKFLPNAAEIIQPFAAKIQQNPKLNLEFTLLKNSENTEESQPQISENTKNSNEEKRALIREYFYSNWEIPADKIVFAEVENKSDADKFRLVLP